MAAMSDKMQSVYNEIKRAVEDARNSSYEDWLGKMEDHPAIRDMYNRERHGEVHGYWDGRTLNALERRGLIKYFDDMDRDDWCVILIEG